MSLDVMYINKAEEIKKKEYNKDLQSSQERLNQELFKHLSFREEEEDDEQKGTLVNTAVVIKGVEVITYVMRMSDEMPVFNFWPRGKEIIHRLIMKAAMTENPEKLRLERTDESILDSVIYK